MIHDEHVGDPDIRHLREIHVEIDDTVAKACGWSDLPLDHGFHKTRQGVRFTIDPAVQVEVLDRLLERNHQIYSEELADGLHSGGWRKPNKQASNVPRTRHRQARTQWELASTTASSLSPTLCSDPGSKSEDDRRWAATITASPIWSTKPTTATSEVNWADRS